MESKRNMMWSCTVVSGSLRWCKVELCPVRFGQFVFGGIDRFQTLSISYSGMVLYCKIMFCSVRCWFGRLLPGNVMSCLGIGRCHYLSIS